MGNEHCDYNSVFYIIKLAQIEILWLEMHRITRIAEK